MILQSEDASKIAVLKDVKSLSLEERKVRALERICESLIVLEGKIGRLLR